VLSLASVTQIRIFVSESWDHNVATNRARPLKMDEGISALKRGYSTGHV